MGVTHNEQPLVRALRRIAAFVNAMGPGATPAGWDVFLKEVGHLTPEEQAIRDALGLDVKDYWRVTWDEAKKLRGEIDYDLRFLKADTPPERPLDDLLERLNELKLPMVWGCKPLGDGARPDDPSAATLSIRWKNGETKRWTARSLHFTYGLRAHLYAVLGAALTSGLLSRLRTCQRCEQYHVVSRATRKFCPRCKVTYHNHNRPKGYAQDRRARIRAGKLKDAQALRRAGKLTLSEDSIELLHEKTELPRRVIAAEIFKKKQTGVTVPKRVARKPAAPRPPVVETKEAIAARLRPVIADYYKRMAKLDQRKPVQRVTLTARKKR